MAPDAADVLVRCDARESPFICLNYSAFIISCYHKRTVKVIYEVVCGFEICHVLCHIFCFNGAYYYETVQYITM